MEPKKSSIFINALVISLIIIAFQLVLHFTGNAENTGLSFIAYIILIVGLCAVCTQYSKSNNAQVTFGNLFAHGFKTTAFIILIMIVWSLLMFKVIFPDLQNQLIEAQRTAMLKQNMPEAQMEKGMEIANKFFMTFVIGGTILMFGIVGAIGSLIGAAISKKVPKGGNPFEQ